LYSFDCTVAQIHGHSSNSAITCRYRLYKDVRKELLERSSRTLLLKVLVNPVTSYEKRFHKPFILSTTIYALSEEAVLLAIDAVLRLLKDGEWHDMEGITKRLALQEFRVEMIVSFLSDYGFIEFDKKGRKVKLNLLTREFIDDIYHVEEEEAMRALRLR